MTIHQHRKNKPAIKPGPKEELIRVLRPLRRVTWINNFIKKIHKNRDKEINPSPYFFI